MYRIHPRGADDLLSGAAPVTALFHDGKIE
jgi:hypothetical protein